MILLKYRLYLICSAVFLLGFVSTYFLLPILTKKPQANINIQNAQINNNLFENVETPQEDSKEFSAVLLGSGGAGHSGGGLTDSIIIVNVNPETKRANIISVPRDLYVPGNRKINAEVSANGVESVKSVLNGVTGIEINKYASIDFNSLIKLIDTLGGIEVELNKPYNDYFYPIKGKENELCDMPPQKVTEVHQMYSGFELEKQFTCRYEQIHFDVGVTKIDGETALKFARSRHGDSDFGRSARQFAILTGIVKKLSTQSPFETIEDAYSVVTELVKTDLSLDEGVELFKLYGNPTDYEIKKIQLTDQNVLISGKSNAGEYILLPRAGKNNFDDVKSFINSKIYNGE